MSAPQLSPILQAAKDILTENKNRAMHVNEIAAEAIRSNRNLGFTEEDFATKVSSALAQNIKTKTPTFLKPKNPKTGTAKKGYYKLKKFALQPTVQVQKKKAPVVPTTYLGTAGEYAVASELLFWKFNIARPAVDDGIDLIVETRPTVFKYVQVKTASAKTEEDGSQTFDFSIDEKAFTLTKSKNPWYIFVMRMDTENFFAVIPYSHLFLLRQQNIIRGNSKLSIQITRESSGRQYKLCGSELNLYINNFELLDNFS